MERKLNPETFEKTEDIPGWGYRYKVRLMGHHDKDESDLESKRFTMGTGNVSRDCWWWSRWIISKHWN